MIYSQNEEEKYILEAVGDTGHFWDIGAYDGKSLSNTFALIERGWSGVMVEPGLQSFQALLKRHGGNPRLTLVHTAVGCDFGPVLKPFWDAPEPYGTTEEANRLKWGFHATFSPAYHTVVVTPKDLMEAFPMPVDVLSIDTEGTSVDLFTEFPIFGEHVTIFPTVICVEHDGRIAECLEHAGHYGYREVYRSAENLVLVR